MPTGDRQQCYQTKLKVVIYFGLTNAKRQKQQKSMLERKNVTQI